MAKKILFVVAVAAVLTAGAILLRPESRPPIVEGRSDVTVQLAADATVDSRTEKVEAVAAGVQSDQNRTAHNVPVEDRLVPPVQALPSVPGFDLRPGFSHLTSRLAGETRDPGWAAEMEARIREVIGDEFPMDGLELECRMSTCGIVLVGEFIGLREEQREFFLRLPSLLAETLGFEQGWNTGRIGAVGRAFTAIFLLDAEGRSTFAPGQDPVPMISALPGIAGFELPASYGDLVEHPAQTLASELEDPVWSSDMEARILSEISTRLSGVHVSQIHIVCRTSTCGIAIQSTPVSNVGIRVSELQRDLAASLGFRTTRIIGTGTEDGSSLLVLYLHLEDRGAAAYRRDNPVSP